MILLYAILVLAFGWAIYSLIDLRRMRRELEEIQRDIERFRGER